MRSGKHKPEELIGKLCEVEIMPVQSAGLSALRR